jgi:hypothetical protein
MIDLFQEVLYYIDAPEPRRFESLALAVFRYQAAHVPVYRAFLASLDIDPRAIRSVVEIPPVSTLAFKYARIESELQSESPSPHVFLTSGTSIGPGERGRHLVPVPEIYRASALRHLQRMMFPDRARMAMLALHPCADQMPESSLAQMISWCMEEFGDGSALCAATRESVDVAQATEFLHVAQRLNHWVCILGTTASCAALFAALRASGTAIRLPAGSRLMDTGGAKGQSIPLSPEQVANEAHELLGIQPALVINEYGMTEMCSQLYDATSFNSESKAPPGMRIKLAPPWLRPAALDPITLTPKTGPEPGVLAFFDLANIGSISALMTEDIGIVNHDAVIVLGRAPMADPRGCALAIEQFAELEKPLRSSQRRRLTDGNASSNDGPVKACAGGGADVSPTLSEIATASERLRRALATPASIKPNSTGTIFREVIEEMVRGSGRWQRAIQEIAASLGYSESLLAVSLGALISPLRNAGEFAYKVRQRRELLGFIMPGNLPGAGIHELVVALVAGCGAMVKTSSSEPVFFEALAETLRELDSHFESDFGARLQVFSWGRECADLTDALLKNCDRMIAFGDDATITQLEVRARHQRLIAYGSRASGAAVMREALQGTAMAQTADALALDCAMFDQRGCLSPHHIFVEERAREFASEMSAAFSRLAPLLGARDASRRLGLQDAAAIRRARETARSRRLGGQDVELWEDPHFQWTVVFDSSTSFTPSPGFRTVYVSPFSDPSDLERRLEPVRGRLEGFAIATGESAAGAISWTHNRLAELSRLQPVRSIAERCGATYICTPGEMQSPPLTWPHGGGEFIRLFIA